MRKLVRNRILIPDQKANYPAPGHVGDQELVAQSCDRAG
jgi:hypothetical protein